jgi:hypothetical protein
MREVNGLFTGQERMLSARAAALRSTSTRQS